MANAIDIALGPDGDLDTTTGDLRIVYDLDGIAQLVQLAICTVLGEWFADKSIGFDWFGLVFVKDPNLVKIRAALVDVILGVQSMQSVDTLNIQVFDDRSARVDFTATSTYGQVSGSATSPGSTT